MPSVARPLVSLFATFAPDQELGAGAQVAAPENLERSAVHARRVAADALRLQRALLRRSRGSGLGIRVSNNPMLLLEAAVIHASHRRRVAGAAEIIRLRRFLAGLRSSACRRSGKRVSGGGRCPPPLSRTPPSAGDGRRERADHADPGSAAGIA
jgi:hypothetical protein